MDFRLLTAAAACLAALFAMPPLAISEPDNPNAPETPPGQEKPKPEEEVPVEENPVEETPEEETPVEETPTEEEPTEETDVDTTALPPAAPPALGKTVAVKEESGSIRIRLPGSDESVPLDAASGIPTGSLINATNGEVRLRTATASGDTQWAVLGGSKFRVAQPRESRGLTILKLSGPKLAPCASASSAGATSSATRRTRSLWGRGKGRFRTRGRHGAATVRGTKWLTRERCDGTLVRVKEGSVWVNDFTKNRRVLVKAGDQYLARARR